jgi:glutamate 5-kinase
MYEKMISESGHVVGQFLITKRDVENTDCKKNLINAFDKTFEYGAIPIINENDSIAIDEIVYGDNDNLSAIVAKLINADALLILTDQDGLYTANPSTDEDAQLIPVVKEITEDLFKLAGGKGSALGTGGMVTKLMAAQVTTAVGIDTIIMNGADPENIYRVLEGRQVGTFFVANKED